MSHGANRINAAVAFLKEGRSFRVDNLLLGPDEEGIYVTGQSRFSSIQNLTKADALGELEAIKFYFAEMINASPELKEFIHGKTIRYILALRAGMVSIGICSEKNNIVQWLEDSFK